MRHKQSLKSFLIYLLVLALISISISGCGVAKITSGLSRDNSKSSSLNSDGLSNTESQSINSLSEGDNKSSMESTMISQNPISKDQRNSLTISKSNENSSSVSVPDSEMIKNGELFFTTNSDSIIDIIINLPFKEDLKIKYKQIEWSIDGSFNVSFSTAVNSNNKTMLGSMYFKKGRHKLEISNLNKPLPTEISGVKFNFIPSKVYFYPRLQLSEKWMKTLYNPLFNGYVEAEGWEDMWTHCQYLPEKFLYSKLSGKTEYMADAKNAADKFIIEKMIQSTGAAHTVYRAVKNVYEQSIETDMKQGVWDLWRGNAAAVEEMINCYNQFKDIKYLNKAKSCADYILNSWPVINVDGVGNIYSNYTQGDLLLTQSTGRLVMVLCQLYDITKDIRYKNAAIAQGKGILKSQADNGLFFSSIITGWQHGNAFANAILALGWLYKTTADPIYKSAIAKAFIGYEDTWTDEYGSLRLSGTSRITGMSTYLAGRMAQGLFTCAMFTGEISQFRTAEKTLYYAFGRNILYRDMQNKDNGSYYYQLNYEGASNVETSSEVNLGTQQIFYLQSYWSK